MDKGYWIMRRDADIAKAAGLVRAAQLAGEKPTAYRPIAKFLPFMGDAEAPTLYSRMQRAGGFAFMASLHELEISGPHAGAFAAIWKSILVQGLAQAEAVTLAKAIDAGPQEAPPDGKGSKRL